jgi:hypothetical protein
MDDNSFKTTTSAAKTTTGSQSKTTTRREYNWRIEINRRERKGDGYTYHWLIRMTKKDGTRASTYGGPLTSLMARNPKRWARYLHNSKNNKRKRDNGEEGKPGF